MKDVAVIDGELDFYHMDDVLASQYQSSDWTQHTTNQSSSWLRNLSAPGTMHKNVPSTDNTLISSMLGPVTWLVLWREHIVEVA